MRTEKNKLAGNGFSLLELLIVVSIMSMLVALLSPALKTAREQAKGIQCVGNLRQIGMAINEYLHDYDGMWTASLFAETEPSCYWDRMLIGKGYVKNCLHGGFYWYRETVMWCPSFKTNYKDVPAYGLNVYLFWNKWQKVDSIADPAGTLLLADCNGNRTTGAWSNPMLVYRHNGLANVLFVDGHLEPRNMADLKATLVK